MDAVDSNATASMGCMAPGSVAVVKSVDEGFDSVRVSGRSESIAGDESENIVEVQLQPWNQLTL